MDKCGGLPVTRQGGPAMTPHVSYSSCSWLYHKSHCHASQRYAALWFQPFRQLFKWPAVHAAEAVDTKTESVDSSTMVQRFMNQNVNVAIDRDAEVQAYLDQETGEDRVREMFTKE